VKGEKKKTKAKEKEKEKEKKPRSQKPKNQSPPFLPTIAKYKYVPIYLIWPWGIWRSWDRQKLVLYKSDQADPPGRHPDCTVNRLRPRFRSHQETSDSHA
jgi:hypothetical protein